VAVSPTGTCEPALSPVATGDHSERTSERSPARRAPLSRPERRAVALAGVTTAGFAVFDVKPAPNTLA